MQPTTRKFHLLAVAALALCLAGTADGGDLLKKVDQANRVGDRFAFEMEVSSHKGEEVRERNLITGYSRVENDLEIRSLVHFTGPKKVAGRKMLIEGGYIWAQFPKTRNLVRLTPMQILLGEVAFGDILRIVYSRDYDLVDSADTTSGGAPAKVLGLVLKPDRKGANYARIRLVVDAANFRVLAADYSGTGGRLIKSAVFSEPAEFLGNPINRRIEIRDRLKPSNYSVMRYTKMGEVEVPASAFTKELLPKARLYAF